MTQDTGLTAGDWAQIGSAVFTALTALAALVSLLRIESERRRQARPDLHMEVLTDVPNDEMRLTVVNQGGPAREVRVMATIGDFGFFGSLAPTTYWRSGESRSFTLSMPLVRDQDVNGFVEGRDLGKRQLIVGTPGGSTYRWSLRKAKKLSPEREWRKLYPGMPSPLDVRYPQVAMTLVERNA